MRERIGTVEIALTIPDNEAYTALTTLRRLGLEIDDLRRAEIWRFTLDASLGDKELLDRVSTLETIYNPNKHALRLRERDHPEPGEVWVDEPGHDVWEHPVRLCGRALPGVFRVARSVSWRLFAREGVPVSPEIVDRAARMVFYNPAFQKATMA